MNEEFSAALAYRALLSRSQFLDEIELHTVSLYDTQNVGTETTN